MEKLERFLSEQDFASDVKAVYAELREELPVSKAVAELKREFAEARQDEDDAPLFWLGLASAMAESKELTKAVEEKALAYFYNNAFATRYGEISGFTTGDIEEIKEYFASSIGKAKRKPRSTSPYKAVTTWKPGEVYAYLLQSENAQEYGVAGRYLLFHVQDTGEFDKCIVPVVHVYITHNGSLPKSEQELSECILIPPFSLKMPRLRYTLCSLRIKNFENNDNVFCVGEFPTLGIQGEELHEYLGSYGILLWEEIERPLEIAQKLQLI